MMHFTSLNDPLMASLPSVSGISFASPLRCTNFREPHLITEDPRILRKPANPLVHFQPTTQHRTKNRHHLSGFSINRKEVGTSHRASSIIFRASGSTGEEIVTPETLSGTKMAELISTEEYMIRHPLKNRTGPDALLVFLPGALTPPSAYTALLHAIQTESDLRLWVVTIIFTNDVANEPEIRERYQSARKALKAHGFPGEESSSINVFFAGHSLGAFVGRVPALHLAQAFIQMGSWFNPKDDILSQFPKPVLSVSGELDGQIPMHTFARGAGQVAALEGKLGGAFLALDKPTVVIKGMNHCQFSHGIPNRERGDWDPDISIEEARHRVGVVVGAWLQLQVVGMGGAESEEAWEVLSREVEESKAILRPFWDALADEKQGWEGTQAWLVEHQGGGEGLRPFRTEILWHDFKDNFMYSKPWIDSEQDLVVDEAFLQRQGKYAITSSLGLKMKSTEAVRRVFRGRQEGAGVKDSEKESEKCDVASTLNARIFDMALGRCHPLIKRRYERSGKKVRFVSDLVEVSGAKWIESEVEFKAASDGSGMVDVQSSTIMSPVEGVSLRFAGMHYVKVLTVAMAMEYIMVDAFR